MGTVLVILGWLIVVFAVGISIFAVIGFAQEPNPHSLIGVFIVAAAVVTAIAAFGMLFLIVGRSRRPKAALSRLKLWAKCMIVVGLVFSLDMPAFWGGVVLDVFWFRRDPSRSSDGIVIAIVITLASFLAGVVAIVSALLWGRRKRLADMARVFD